MNLNQEYTSKVKSVTANGTWDSQYGTLFTYEYTMEDGVTLQANHKKQEPYAVGTEVAYVVKRDGQYGKSGKVYLPKTITPEGVARDTQHFKGDDNLKGIKIGHSISNGVVLFNHLGEINNMGIKDSIKEYSKLIYQISDELNIELSDGAVKKPSIKSKNEEPESDLPF
jgi:hypothetical protein